MNEYGTVCIEAIYADDGPEQTGARIIQADERVLIAWDLLDLIRSGNLPYAEHDGGSIVTLVDTEADKRVRYLVEGFVGAYGCYAMRRVEGTDRAAS